MKVYFTQVRKQSCGGTEKGEIEQAAYIYSQA